LSHLESLQQGHIRFQAGDPAEKPFSHLIEKKKFHIIRHPLQAPNTSCSPSHLESHAWVSPNQAQTQVVKMAQVLQDTFPQHRETIQQRLDHLTKQLRQLDAACRTILPHRAVITSHESLSYLCHDYQMVELPLEREDKELSLTQLEDLIEQAKKLQVQLVILFPQHPHKGAKLVAERLHIPVVEIDLYQDNYVAMITSLLDTIQRPPS
jgi:ABC-type Zn uptake system ZnuABC Zn-binding protein ZnuA